MTSSDFYFLISHVERISSRTRLENVPQFHEIHALETLIPEIHANSSCGNFFLNFLASADIPIFFRRMNLF